MVASCTLDIRPCRGGYTILPIIHAARFGVDFIRALVINLQASSPSGSRTKAHVILKGFCKVVPNNRTPAGHIVSTGDLSLKRLTSTSNQPKYFTYGG